MRLLIFLSLHLYGSNQEAEPINSRTFKKWKRHHFDKISVDNFWYYSYWLAILIEMMDWCMVGDKPLCEPMVACCPTHKYIQSMDVCRRIAKKVSRRIDRKSSRFPSNSPFLVYIIYIYYINDMIDSLICYIIYHVIFLWGCLQSPLFNLPDSAINIWQWNII